MTRYLNLRYLDFIWKVCIFCKNYSRNREIEISLAHLHAFISQCFPNFPNYKNGYLGRLICHIFGISTVSFIPFQWPNRFVALLPQSDKLFQYHNEYRLLSSFVRTLPVKFHHYLFCSSLAVYAMNQIFLEGFLPRLITPQGNTPSKLSQVSSWHITDPQNDIFTTNYWKLIKKISIPDTVYAILILPVTLAPLTGFHASKRRDINFEFFC